MKLLGYGGDFDFIDFSVYLSFSYNPVVWALMFHVEVQDEENHEFKVASYEIQCVGMYCIISYFVIGEYWLCYCNCV